MHIIVIDIMHIIVIDIMHIIVIDIMHIIVIVPSVSCACSHARLSVGEDGRGQSAL